MAAQEQKTLKIDVKPPADKAAAPSRRNRSRSVSA